MKEPTLSLVITHMYWKALKSIMENILPTVWETSVLGEIKILLIRIRYLPTDFTIDTDGKVADDDNINIIPCSLSSSSNKNDYCPTPLEGDEAERVRQKIEKYSEGL